MGLYQGKKSKRFDLLKCKMWLDQNYMEEKIKVV